MTLEVEIAELSPGGQGVAICAIGGERRAVFVPDVAPGERVKVAIEPGGRPLRGRVVELLERSPARRAPPCASFDRCGGCDWMFLAPERQAEEHASIVGRLLGTSIQPKRHRPAPDLGYRTRARVHVEAGSSPQRRDRAGRGASGVRVGMYGRRSRVPVVVESCIVLHPVLDHARAALATWLEGAEGRGEAQLGLGLPSEPRQAVLDLRWTGELPGAVFGRLERAVSEGALAGARVFAGAVRAPATIGDPTPFLAGPDELPLRLAPGGFSQATERGNVVLARRVAELARELPGGLCVELFAGAGNLSVLLARDRELVAVEQDHDACVAARANLAARSIAGRVVEADASAFALPRSTRLVVLDPPREGARPIAEALAARAKSRPPAVIYVACDPPTLARDVKTLTSAGYTLRDVETFEMFPQTSHVEAVVVLVPPR